MEYPIDNIPDDVDDVHSLQMTYCKYCKGDLGIPQTQT